jgi:O-antigen/teichoic acid export membrane protein
MKKIFSFYEYYLVDNKNILLTLFNYGLSVLGNSISAILLFLVLIRTLEPEQYAGVVLVKSLIIILCTLGGLGLSQAAVKWKYSHSNDNETLSSILLGSAISSLFIGLLSNLFLFFLIEETYKNYNFLLFISIMIMNIMYMQNNELVNWYRAEQKSLQYASYNFIRAGLQFTFVLYFCLNFNPIAGYIYGLLAAEIFLILILIKRTKFFISLNLPLLRQMIAYGIPFAFVNGSSFLINYLDRFLLGFWGSGELVAFYDASFLIILGIMGLLIRPFNLYIFPAYTERYKLKGKVSTVEFILKMQNYFILAATVLSLFLIIFKTIILDFLYPPEYLAAKSIFLPLVFSTVLKGVFITCVAGLFLSNKTASVAVVSILAVISNVIANAFLIREFGMIGAAYASAISNIVLLALSNQFSKKYINIKFPLIQLILSFSSLYIIDAYLWS